MRAVVFREPKKPVSLENVELPSVGRNDVLVRIKAAGICHSDLHLINGLLPSEKIPIVLGHEGAGVIAKKGEEVSNLSLDDRVFIDYVYSCGNCKYCHTGKDNLCDHVAYYGFQRDGTWAEYMLVPAQNVFRIPDSVPFDQASLAGCAVVTGYHAMKIAEVRPGNSVAVIGLGGVGIQVVQWSKLCGATEIIGIDVDDYKLELARELGATSTVNAKQQDFAEAVMELTDDKGVDIGFEVIGLKETIEKMLPMVRKGGKAVIVGLCNTKISMVPIDMTFKETQIRFLTDHTKSEMMDVLYFLGKRRFDLSKIITHRLPIDQVSRGIEMLERRIDKPVRIVIEP